MKTNAKMNRKDAAIESEPCIIEDIVELDAVAYAKFRRALLDDYDFIGEHIDLMRRDENGWHCLLVLGKGQNDGVLVESEGSDYARYSAHLPNARQFVNSEIRRLASYVVSEGKEHTEDGRWSNTYEEFRQHFDTTVTDTNGIGQLLKEELEQRQEVAECIMAEDCIEMTYHLEYCEQCQQGGVVGAMSLLSVVGCNIEDEHEMQNSPEDTEKYKRYTKILSNALGYMTELIHDDNELYRVLHETFGMSNDEIEDMGIDSLAGCYEESDSDMTQSM